MNRLARAVIAVGIASAGLLLAPTAAAASAAATQATTTQAGRFPTHIALPIGFQPEGIAIRGHYAYFGSRVSGAIYRADLRTGAGRIVVPAPNPPVPALGLKIDDRGRLYVAGAASGTGRVIDLRTGATLVQYQFAPGAPTFVNDVVLTPKAAYFTDSNRAVLYKVAFGRHGKLPRAFETVQLTGFDMPNPTMTNANGIARTPDGRALLVINSTTGVLYRINPTTGTARAVDIGASLAAGDGLLTIGRTLYVVQNRLNTVTVVRLNKAGTSGRVVDHLTSPDFRVPTTVAAYGNRLYLPNARFGDPNPADLEYWATAVRR